jgi:hypothetical protein
MKAFFLPVLSMLYSPSQRCHSPPQRKKKEKLYNVKTKAKPFAITRSDPIISSNSFFKL